LEKREEELKWPSKKKAKIFNKKKRKNLQIENKKSSPSSASDSYQPKHHPEKFLGVRANT